MINRMQATERNGSGYRYSSFHAPVPGTPDRCVRMRRNGSTQFSSHNFRIPVKNGKYAGVITSDMALSADAGLYVEDECPRCHPESAGNTSR